VVVSKVGSVNYLGSQRIRIRWLFISSQLSVYAGPSVPRYKVKLGKTLRYLEITLRNPQYGIQIRNPRITSYLMSFRVQTG
jgi:hypothetical protein